jgi:hypothetical protein
MTRHTAQDGTFQFRQLLQTPETLALHVHPPGGLGGGSSPSATVPAVMVQRSVGVGSNDLRIVVPATSAPTAWVSGRVADSVPKNTVLWLASEDDSFCYVKRKQDGTFSCGPLAPGNWRILQKAYPRNVDVIRFVLNSREALELGTLEVKPIAFGKLDIVLTGAQRHPEFATEFQGLATAQILVQDDRAASGLQFVRWLELKQEHTELNLVAGRYVVRLSGAPLWSSPQSCEIETGKTCSVTFDARPAAMQRVAFRHPQSWHPFEPLDLAVHNEAGQLIWSMRIPPRESWWHAELSLPPGTYQLTASTASGLHCERQLGIRGKDVSGRPLVIDLQQ